MLKLHLLKNTSPKMCSKKKSLKYLTTNIVSNKFETEFLLSTKKIVKKEKKKKEKSKVKK